MIPADKFRLIHFIKFKNNCRVIFSDYFGKSLYSRSAGRLQYKNISKKHIKVAFAMIGTSFNWWRLQGSSKNEKYLIVLQFTGFASRRMYALIRRILYYIKLMKIGNISIIGYRICQKIAFNGCRHRVR